MPDLHFSKIQGESIVFSKYTTVTHNNLLYIEPANGSFSSKINPLENIDELVMDIINTARVISSCKTYMNFLSGIAESNIVYEKKFWNCPDFFSGEEQNEISAIIDEMLTFVEKYGLPDWELKKDTKAILPLEYSVYSTALNREESESPEYIKKYLSDKISLENVITYPVCSLTLFFLDFLNMFTYNRTSKLKRVEHCRLYYRNEGYNEPDLEAIAIGLYPSIILALITFTSGEHKIVRICKQCGKHFITGDMRSEYCSSKCRAAYNTAQTRKRKKLKKQKNESK